MRSPSYCAQDFRMNQSSRSTISSILWPTSLTANYCQFQTDTVSLFTYLASSPISYQLYIKHLIAVGKTEKALSLVHKALELDPDHQNLIFMRDYLEKK